MKEFKESFKKCQYQYKIDKLVYLCEYDNRLIVDTEREEFIEIIYLVAKKNGSIELCELEKGLFEGNIVRDKKGRNYVSEMVFSCILDKKEHEINKLNQESYVKNNMILQTRNRIFPPFKDGWIYMKLYGIGNRENEVNI